MNIWINGTNPVSTNELAARIAKQLDVKLHHCVVPMELDAEHSVIDIHPHIFSCVALALSLDSQYFYPLDPSFMKKLSHDRNSLYVYLECSGSFEHEFEYWRLWQSQIHVGAQTIGVQKRKYGVDIHDCTVDHSRVIQLHPSKGEEFQQIADEVVQIVRRWDQPKHVQRENDLNL